MNEKRLPLLVLMLLALFGACSGRASEAPPLEGARLGGSFTLTDQNGRQVSDRQFDGRYRIVYFGFTYCPDVCPVDLQTIGQAMRMLEKSDPSKAERVQPIFITVDPERDTPGVMKQYVSSFHPRLIGLTGTREQIAEVAKKHGVYSGKAEESGATEYMVDHSRIALLFGPKGEPIAILPHEKGAEAVAAELRRWVL
ncbi:MAG: SCO family protein [Pseudomonadota bacterium]|nr:SCO family protein [Pseudomonadota bacterium]